MNHVLYEKKEIVLREVCLPQMEAFKVYKSNLVLSYGCSHCLVLFLGYNRGHLSNWVNAIHSLHCKVSLGTKSYLLVL